MNDLLSHEQAIPNVAQRTRKIIPVKQQRLQSKAYTMLSDADLL